MRSGPPKDKAIENAGHLRTQASRDSDSWNDSKKSLASYQSQSTKVNFRFFSSESFLFISS